MATTMHNIPLVGLALVVGSLGTLVPKFLLSTPCTGTPDPALHAPLAAALCVFLASTLCLAIPLRSAALQQPPPPWGALLARCRPLLLPALLCALGTALQLAALLFISAAALAGLRGVFILWTAQLSQRLALKDAPATPSEWRCIYACAAGALCVGAGAVAEAVAAPGSAGQEGGGSSSIISSMGGAGGAAATGVLLSIAGYAFASAQVACEQVLLDGSYSRWEILGGEGALSSLATLLALGALQGAFEATQAASGVGLWGALDVPSHTLQCAARTPAVPAWALAYGATGITFNSLLLTVAKDIGPNMRVLVFTARGVLTWGVEVGVYYAGGALGVRGTALTPYSVLTLLGFGALIWGGSERARLVAEREAAAKGGEGAQQQQQEPREQQPGAEQQGLSERLLVHPQSSD